MIKKRSSFVLFVIILLASMLPFFSANMVGAHSPSEVNLEYDTMKEELTVEITHHVTNPQTHYVENIVIEVDSITVIDETYTEQPTDDTFEYTYDLQTDEVSTIKVTANCNQGGSNSNSIEVGKDYHELSIDTDGQGKVEVRYDDDIHEVEDQWSQEIEEGTEVTLKATPHLGWEFVRWRVSEELHDENPDVENEEITFTMVNDVQLTAVFGFREHIITHELSLDIHGEGIIEVGYDEITYEVKDQWSQEIEEGTEVTLKATPDQGWEFIEWDIPEELHDDIDDQEDGEVTFTMVSNVELTAVFEIKYVIAFEVTLDIQGEGTVEVQYNGETYEVDDQWSQEIEEGTEVTLKATPDQGWEFIEWEGIDENNAEENITINEDIHITANFEEEEVIPGFTLIPIIIASMLSFAIYYKKKQ